MESLHLHPKSVSGACAASRAPTPHAGRAATNRVAPQLPWLPNHAVTHRACGKPGAIPSPMMSRGPGHDSPSRPRHSSGHARRRGLPCQDNRLRVPVTGDLCNAH